MNPAKQSILLNDKKHVKVEMIHDLVCSWCPIGYANISKAAELLENSITLNLQFLPFELNPDMPNEGQTIGDYFRRRFGMDEATILANRKKTIATGKEAGVRYDFTKRTHYYNTRLGHDLLHYAASLGKHLALNEVLIKTYFELGKNISLEAVLAPALTQVGIDVEHAFNNIQSKSHVKVMDEKRQKVRELGIRTIPTLLINDRQILPGSGTVAHFAKALKSAALCNHKDA